MRDVELHMLRHFVGRKKSEMEGRILENSQQQW